MRPALVVFDLDDTLIDTRNVLLPDALRRVAEATGVPVELLDPRGKRIEEVLANADVPPARREAAAAAWYHPEVPPLEPLPGARQVLTALRGRVHLALLTRGMPERQRNKVAACGVGLFFEAVVVRPIEEPGTKRDDLLALMTRFRIPPECCAVVGDDDRDEIAHARSLGCLALKVPDVPLAAIPERLREAGLLPPAT